MLRAGDDLMMIRKHPDAMWRLVVAAVVLLPFWQLVVMQGVLVTDDYFVSDIWGGEFPVLVWAGAELRAGRIPLWTSSLFCGLPMVPPSPIQSLLFAALPPVAAINLEIVGLLTLLSQSTYSLARVFRCARPGASLAAVAFGLSGFVVCQLKHLGALGTAAFFPLVLVQIKVLASVRRGGCGLPSATRWRATALLALFLGLQILQGFPQTLYYGCFAYLAYAMSLLSVPRLRSSRSRRRLVGAYARMLLAVAIGAAMGAMALVPFRDITAVSERRAGVTLEWVRRYAFLPKNLLNFIVPYANGDISNGTYGEGGTFWEDYGYVGLVTLLFAIAAVVLRARRRAVQGWLALALGALVLVLGPATPLFTVIFHLVPGMKLFRFTTRAMFLLDLSLAMLSAFGLTALLRTLARRSSSPRAGAMRAVGAAVVVVASLDLLWFQPRQNAIGAASEWAATPPNAELVRGADQRLYTIQHRNLHRGAFHQARGWADLRPYLLLRDLIEPNTNLLWNIDTADGYSGLVPDRLSWVWGAAEQLSMADRVPAGSAQWRRVLETFSVTRVIAVRRIRAEGVKPLNDTVPFVYEMSNALPRVRVVGGARFVRSRADAEATFFDRGFDPRTEIVVEGDGESRSPSSPGTAKMVVDRVQSLEIEAQMSERGYLVLSDTFFPSWRAYVDDRPAPILLANLNQRAIALDPGPHAIRFSLEWTAARAATIASWVLFASLATAASALSLVCLRRRRQRAAPGVV